ncbi:MAG: toxin [Elusimicrobia bacterium]|nr:toxin [Elusimicrobiota bacterium]
MKEIRWDLTKSERLKKIRGVSFEEIIQTKFIAALKHPKKLHQNIMLFEHKNYIWVVPYVEDTNGIFLKTLFPSRKYTKIYRRGGL